MRNKKKKKKKNFEKTHAKENNHTHAQDNIYVVRQFAYIHGVAGISLLSGKKNTKCGYSVFLSLKDMTTPNKKP